VKEAKIHVVAGDRKWMEIVEIVLMLDGGVGERLVP